MSPHRQELELHFGGPPEDFDRPRARSLFDRWGCLVAKGIFRHDELRPVQDEIQQLLRLAWDEAKSGASPSHGIPTEIGYAALFAYDQKMAKAVFSACRRLTSVHQLSVNHQLLNLSQFLMQTKLVISSPYKPVRIDLSGREEHLLPWHQDYPYAQDSMDGVVYWIPLQDVDDRNGCLMVAPGSHKLGIVPVRMRQAPTERHRGSVELELADASVVAEFPQLSLPMQLGDALVLSTLLLHRSQQNHTDIPRWTVQIRHGNFSNPMAIKKRWPLGHFESQWFNDTHPEFIHHNDDGDGL